ncbi:hypothetical protein K2X05_10320, partial [bacterium]|nr:hypothetical protein [bacterium]
VTRSYRFYKSHILVTGTEKSRLVFKLILNPKTKLFYPIETRRPRDGTLTWMLLWYCRWSRGQT